MMRRDVDFEPLEDIFLDYPQETGQVYNMLDEPVQAPQQRTRNYFDEAD